MESLKNVVFGNRMAKFEVFFGTKLYLHHFQLTKSPFIGILNVLSTTRSLKLSSSLTKEKR